MQKLNKQRKKIQKALICAIPLSLSGTVFAQFLESQPTKTAISVQSLSSVSKISVIGNKTVSIDAILNMLSFKAGEILTQSTVSSDIKTIYNSGYFSDVQIKKGNSGEIIVSVIEKPTINEILFQGFNIVTSSSLEEKIVSKKYTIVDEKKISQDLNTIEQAYVEKGYYLSKSSYVLQSVQPGVVNIVFKITENAPVTVRRVNYLGNSYFNDSELQTYSVTKPYSWLSVLNSSGLFKNDFLNADQNNLTYIYRDNGYAEATVAAPLALMDKSKTDVDVSYYIEQGERFNIGKITITGDLILSEQEVKNQLSLKEGDLYRISKFTNDMHTLKIIYGDQGYAFVYVYPQFNIDRKNKIYNINYTITKGDKAYFRNIVIEGNVKTRDNVIRRNLKISEEQLFNATNLDKSKAKVEKLGFFESVDIIQNPDPKNDVIDLRVVVKEKSTGSLNAAIGASPNSSGGTGLSYFANFQYQEKNLFGKAYALSSNIQVSPNPQGGGAGELNYSLGLNFANPSIFDSPWGYSIGSNYSKQVTNITSTSSTNQTYLTQKTTSIGFSISRQILENVRLSLGYSMSKVDTDPSVALTSKFFQSGKTEEISQVITYDGTDNNMAPTSGFYASGTNAFGIEGFIGQYQYGKISANLSYYIPINLAESFKTNFRFGFIPQFLYELNEEQPVPYWKRLTLGNAYYMKGFSGRGEMISPTTQVSISPVTGQTVPLYYGGDRSYYGTIEYFIPVIPEAGLRMVTFAETGTVLDDYDTLSLNSFKLDFGFGFRWITPIAPFRFEWAFPVDSDGKIGDAHFIFSIGYDNLGSLNAN